MCPLRHPPPPGIYAPAGLEELSVKLPGVKMNLTLGAPVLPWGTTFEIFQKVKRYVLPWGKYLHTVD